MSFRNATMLMRNNVGVLLVSLALCAPGVAQQADPPNQSSSAPDPAQHYVPAPAMSGGLLSVDSDTGDGEVPWSTARPQVPAIVGGYGSSLAFGTEMARSNYIRGGLSVQSTFDDNPFLTPSGGQNNYTYSIFPQISLDQSRPRTRWVLNYAGGFTFNDQLSSQDHTSQNVNFDGQYRLSPHVNLRVSEIFSITSGLFSGVNTFNGTSPGVPDGGNSFVITPISNQLTNITKGEISYQFSATDVVGGDGGYYTNRYRDEPAGTTLIDNQSANGAGFYMHRLTPGNWLGTGYVFQRLTFPPTDSETLIQTVVVFDTLTLNKTMSLSVFAGPQYSDNKAGTTPGSPLAVQTGWSVAGGASYSWQGMHSSAYATFVRRITDGGGLLGAGQVNSASAAFRHQLTAHWSAGVRADFATNDAIGTPLTSTSSIKTASGGISVDRQFGQQVFLSFGYLHQFQRSVSTSLESGDANRNQVIVTLGYQFSRPWGR